MTSRSTLHPKRDWSSPHFQLCSRFASGCARSSSSQACAPSRSPGVTARAASDKLGLTRARKPLGKADRQRGGAVDREIVETDEAHHPPVEPRLEDVVAVAALAGLWIERHPPHARGVAARARGVFDPPPVQQISGLEVLGVRARASEEVDELGAEEEHDRHGQQTVIMAGKVDANLTALPEQAEQILVVGAPADRELLAGGGLLEELIKAVHRRRGLRGLDRDAQLDAGSDVTPG